MSLNPALCIEARERLPSELFDSLIEFLLSNLSFLRVLLLLHQSTQIRMISKKQPMAAHSEAMVT
jgi:hypothetical protein